MEQKLPIVRIYTDGSCSPNPGPGGWAAILLFDDGRKVIELQGSDAFATNNRMELLAALKGLQKLEEKNNVEVITDSKYLQQGVTRWLERWQANGWKTAEGLPVKNRDLWEQFARQIIRHQLKWCWVKGHSVDRWNIRADELAVSARKKQLTPQHSKPFKNIDGVNFFPAVTWKNTNGSGSWTTILNFRDHYKVIGGCAEHTTANRLYLQAVIEGIKTLKRALPINIYTRSGYLRDGLETWMVGWQKRGWQTREGAEVSNKEQWQELASLKKGLEINVIVVSAEDPPCLSQEAKEIAREFEQLQI